MLVLTRKCNESLLIDVGGEQIRVQVVAINGSRVKIGVDASRDVLVMREEIHGKMLPRPEISRMTAEPADVAEVR